MSMLCHWFLSTDGVQENILVSGEGRALSTDFGLSLAAMSVATTSSQSLTGATTNWMAPELFTSKPTNASDIWSFGCVCYEVRVLSFDCPLNAHV